MGRFAFSCGDGGGVSVHAYIHLPSRHKVCALPDPLKDLLQLGVDEGVVWRKHNGKLSEKKCLESLWCVDKGRTSEHHLAVTPSLQCVPWMLSICPILSAAPRTLHSVLTILSALASDSRGESNKAFASKKAQKTQNRIISSDLEHMVLEEQEQE